MRKTRTLFIILIFLFGLGSCSPAEQQTHNPTIILQNVAILDIKNSSLLENQTLVVENGVIVHIGEEYTSTISPEIVDGTGLTLMPGLTDMHVHLEWFQDPDILPYFLLHGVTFVRQMDGRPEHLIWRKRQMEGSLPGPFLQVGGKILEGPNPLWDDTRVVTTIDEAKQAVRNQHELGYDFIKVYHTLPADLYQAIINEANALDMPVAGHVPGQPGLLEVLASNQQSIEHLSSFARAIKMEGSNPVPELSYLGHLYFGMEIDLEKQSNIVNKTGESGTIVVPTLSMQKQLLDAVRSENPHLPFKDNFPRNMFQFWLGTHGYLQGEMGEIGIAAGEAGYTRKQEFLKSLYLGGVALLIGTDTPQPFVFPGLSVYQEMQEFSNVGIANKDILKFATITPSKFVDEFPGGGEIAMGGVANFILVEGNPLDDLTILKNVSGVMVGKTWLTKEDIQELIEKTKGRPYN